MTRKYTRRVKSEQEPTEQTKSQELNAFGSEIVYPNKPLPIVAVDTQSICVGDPIHEPGNGICHIDHAAIPQDRTADDLVAEKVANVKRLEAELKDAKAELDRLVELAESQKPVLTAIDHQKRAREISKLLKPVLDKTGPK